MKDAEFAAKALEDAADYYKRQLGTVGAFDIPLHPRDFAPWLRARAARARLSAALCACGHDRDYHGNADGQTGWQAHCGHPDCDCDDFDGVEP